MLHRYTVVMQNTVLLFAICFPLCLLQQLQTPTRFLMSYVQFFSQTILFWLHNALKMGI